MLQDKHLSLVLQCLLTLGKNEFLLQKLFTMYCILSRTGSSQNSEIYIVLSVESEKKIVIKKQIEVPTAESGGSRKWKNEW